MYGGRAGLVYEVGRSVLLLFRPSAWMVLHPFVVLLLIVVFIGLSHVFVQLSKIDILPNWCF